MSSITENSIVVYKDAKYEKPLLAFVGKVDHAKKIADISYFVNGHFRGNKVFY